MKTKDKLLWAFGAVFLIALIIWGICEAAGSDFYNYDGYITEIRRNEKNQTVLTTISGDKTSEFVLKWSSRKKYEKDVREITVGDYVMLSTTRFSHADIKKISIDEGYSTEGKLIYVNEADSPFILSVGASADQRYLIEIEYIGELNGMIGDKIRIYHYYPIHEQSGGVLSDAYRIISDESELTIEEIAFIAAKGYTVKG
jgi:hypothetical protein